MFALLKWIVLTLVAGFLWLVGMYTAEYFRPYKKITISKYEQHLSQKDMSR